MENEQKIIRDEKGRFVKGIIPANKGKQCSEEERRVISINNLGKYKEKRQDVWDRKDEIIKMYNEEDKSLNQIKNIFNCSSSPIQKILKENNIKMKQKGLKKGFHRPLNFDRSKNLGKYTEKIGFTPEQKEKIIKSFEIDLLSAKKISKDFNCSWSTIIRFLKEEGIDVSKNHWKKIGNSRRGVEFTEEHRKNLSKAMKGKDSPRKGLTTEEEYGTEKAMEISKKHSSTHQGITLDKWEKFISREPYDQRWIPQFRNSIRKRDNQVCMNCGIHREKLNYAFSVHHINYDKKMSISENCVSLCKGCHSLTNYNKEYWQKLFQEKLSKIYGYQYSEDGKIIINLTEVKI